MGAGMDPLKDSIIQIPARQGIVAALVSSRHLEPPNFDVPPMLDMDYLDRLLMYCVENKVEDLIITTGEPVSILWSDEVHRLGGRTLYNTEIQDLLCSLVRDPNAAIEVARAQYIDFAYSLDVDRNTRIRFRCVATGCLVDGGSGLELIFRPVGKKIPTTDELGIESYIVDNATPSAGIVLVTGPTGSGKSTLLDAILRRILTTKPAKRVVTFFSPIENDLRDIPDRVGLVTQSEIGRPGFGAHIQSYPEAIRNMLRRHPHVVVLGEARDRETIDGAVMSALSNHLTYTTTHTASTHMTIPRMVDSFRAEERVRITKSLIENTRLIVHQRLLPTTSGLGRVAVRSALNITSDMRDELMRASIDSLPILVREYTDKYGITLMASAQKQFTMGNIAQRTLDAIEQEVSSRAGE